MKGLINESSSSAESRNPLAGVSFFLMRNKNLGRVIVLAAGFLIIAVFSIFNNLPDGKVHIKFYDVGQGDSIFIRTPAGHKILVDGGPDNKVLSYLGEDLPFWDRSLDLVISTHPHSDHLTGLLEVLKRYKVKKVLLGKMSHTTDQYLEFLKLIKDRGVPTDSPKKGDKISLDDDVNLKFLSPKGYSGEETDLNLSSLVFLLSFRDFEVLLTGDASKESQPYGQNLGQIDVLKVPHHGSKDALDSNFLKTLKPKLAIISVGKDNRFGHPAQNTLETLENLRVETLRTDLDGTVEIDNLGLVSDHK